MNDDNTPAGSGNQRVQNLNDDFLLKSNGSFENSKKVNLSIKSDTKEITFFYPNSEFNFLAVVDLKNCSNGSKDCICDAKGCLDIVKSNGKCSLTLTGQIEKVISEYDLIKTGFVTHLYWKVLESKILYTDKKTEDAELLEYQGFGTFDQQAKFICVHYARKHLDPLIPDTITYDGQTVSFGNDQTEIFKRVTANQ